MFKFYLKKTIFLSFYLFFHVISFAQPQVSLTSVINGLSSPIQLVNAGDGTNRIFIVQQGGIILVYDQSYNVLGTFLTVSNISTGGERGLLSMAFPPGYEDPTNNLFGYFFVYYTNLSGDLELARYQVGANANIANASSKTIVLTIPHPVNANHNGGTLHFGNDGYLYFATGDGGGAGDISNNAQNGNVLLGKMLRIAVNSSAAPPFYTVPVDNPFVSAIDTLHQICAFGLRNPFRWAFDRSTHDMWIADVGQGAWEEINYTPAASTAGINYGWHCYEGNTVYNTSDCDLNSAFVSPVYAYVNPGNGAAVTGGPVYRGSVPANAALTGYHLAADFYSGNIYKTKPNGSGGWITFVQNAVQTGIANFGETEDGEIYAVSLTTGTVYSIAVTSVLPVLLSEFTGSSRNGMVELKWKTSSEQNLKQFEIEYSLDKNSFIRTGIIPAINNITGAAYLFSHSALANQMFYRLKMTDIDGEFKYSEIIMLQINRTNNQFVLPSVMRAGTINVLLNASFNTFELISTNGVIVLKQSIKGRTGKLEIPVGSVRPGTYIALLKNNEITLQQKILIQ